MRTWQADIAKRLSTSLPAGSTVEVHGSAADDAATAGVAPDGWSDLDVYLTLARRADVSAIVSDPLWAWQDTTRSGVQTLRLVLTDGRRIDAVVRGSRVTMPSEPDDLGVRFDAALAAVRMGRGNRLIGLHLTYEVLRHCLVQAMLLADRSAGSDHHRHGSEHDARADIVAEIAAGPIGTEQVERACALYGAWRRELEPEYVPDWSGLRAMIARGRAS